MTDSPDQAARRDALQHYSAPYYVEKYATGRRSAAELFRSERHFLEQVLEPGMSVLDIGCACGGMAEALEELSGPVQYTGVDVTPAMIDCARRLDPNGEFFLIDAAEGLPFAAESFDLVMAFGVTVHEPRYRRLLEHAFAVTRRHLLYDIHVWNLPNESTDRDTGYVVNASGERNHYIVANWESALEFATALQPRPDRVEMFGYFSKIDTGKVVVLPGDLAGVCTAAILVTRGSGSATTVNLELPAGLTGSRE